MEDIQKIKNFVIELINILKYIYDNNDLKLLKLLYGAICIKSKELNIDLMI